jgi:hypothetical protein
MDVLNCRDAPGSRQIVVLPGRLSASTEIGDGGRAIHRGLRARIGNHVFWDELMCGSPGTFQLLWRRLAS